MNIELITMTLAEVEHALQDTIGFKHRSSEIITGAMPPEIIFVSAVERHRVGEQWFWCAPRLFLFTHKNLIVGSGCFKNSPCDGAVEIGCGVAETHRGRGFATQGVELLVAEGFSVPEVTAITAETAIWNAASQRVLEKALFGRCGSRIDPDDGHVIMWRRERASGRIIR